MIQKTTASVIEFKPSERKGTIMTKDQQKQSTQSSGTDDQKDSSTPAPVEVTPDEPVRASDQIAVPTQPVGQPASADYNGDGVPDGQQDVDHDYHEVEDGVEARVSTPEERERRQRIALNEH